MEKITCKRKFLKWKLIGRMSRRNSVRRNKGNFKRNCSGKKRNSGMQLWLSKWTILRIGFKLLIRIKLIKLSMLTMLMRFKMRYLMRLLTLRSNGTPQWSARSLHQKLRLRTILRTIIKIKVMRLLRKLKSKMSQVRKNLRAKNKKITIKKKSNGTLQWSARSLHQKLRLRLRLKPRSISKTRMTKSLTPFALRDTS